MSKSSSKKTSSTHETRLRLKYPFEIGEESIDELVLRRPKAKDIETLSANPDMKELLTIGAKIAGKPKPVIDRLDATDALALVEVVGDFLGGGREIGGVA